MIDAAEISGSSVTTRPSGVALVGDRRRGVGDQALAVGGVLVVGQRRADAGDPGFSQLAHQPVEQRTQHRRDELRLEATDRSTQLGHPDGRDRLDLDLF